MTYWHIILKLPPIGLMIEGLQMEVARNLKKQVIEQLEEMSTERFLTYCTAERRRILPYKVDDGILAKAKHQLEMSFQLPKWMDNGKDI